MQFYSNKALISNLTGMIEKKKWTKSVCEPFKQPRFNTQTHTYMFKKEAQRGNTRTHARERKGNYRESTQSAQFSRAAVSIRLLTMAVCCESCERVTPG